MTAVIEKKKKRLVWLKRDWRLYLMLILPIAQYILFRYRPMQGILIAFQKYNLFKGIWGSKWVGMDNFKFVFSLKDFTLSLRNTLFLNFLDLIAGFPVPIILAIMLTEMRSVKLKRVSQTLLYLPHFLSWVIIGGMVLEIFAPTYGIINKTIISLGGNNVPFLSDGPHWVATYVLVGVWQNMGWGTILYLAAITNINIELYEAAEIDGANKMQRIWHVTIPGIRSTIVILLILNIGQMMNIGFDRPFIIGNTLVQQYCDVISTFVYRVAMKGAKYDRGAAIGLFQSVVGFIMIMTANFITRRIGEESIW